MTTNNQDLQHTFVLEYFGKLIRKWRLFSLFLTLLIAVLIFQSFGSSGFFNLFSKEHFIAQLSIDGIISRNDNLINQIEKIRTNNKADALILEIDSPGGSVTASFDLYDSLKKLANTKPLVVVMGSMATSGGYLAALPAHHIIARASSITGSIGVIFFNFDVTEFAKKIGVTPSIFRTGKFKAVPTPLEKVTPEIKVLIDKNLEEIKEQFLALVIKNRELSEETIKTISDSGIFLGQTALKMHLVDDLGSLDTALNWLKTSKQIEAPLQKINCDTQKEGVLKFFSRSNSSKMSLSTIIEEISKALPDLPLQKSGFYLLGPF